MVKLSDEGVAQRAGALKTLRDLARQTPRFALDSELAEHFKRVVEELWADASEREKEIAWGAWREAFGVEKPTVRRKRVPFESLFVDDKGWFKKYLEYTSPGKSSPQFFFAAALAYIAGGLGHGPRIKWEAATLYPNLMILMIGGSGSGKGAAVEKAEELVQPAMGANILGNEGSQQGFADQLQDRWEMTEEAADGMIVAEELKMLLGEDRYKTELVTWITGWYTHGDKPWERTLRSGTISFRNPCLTLLGGSNMPWLKRLPRDALSGGFIPRSLLFDTPKEEERWGVAMPKYDAALHKELRRHLMSVAAEVPDELGFTKEGERWLEEWYQGPLRTQYENATEEQVEFWLARKQSVVMKMAAIKQLIDFRGTTAIGVAALEWAVRVADWCDQSVEAVYKSLGVTQEGEVVEDVLEFLQRRKGTATQRQIKRGLRNRHRARKVMEALMSLEEEGDLKKRLEAGKGITWETT